MCAYGPTTGSGAAVQPLAPAGVVVGVIFS